MSKSHALFTFCFCFCNRVTAQKKSNEELTGWDQQVRRLGKGQLNILLLHLLVLKYKYASTQAWMEDTTFDMFHGLK